MLYIRKDIDVTMFVKVLVASCLYGVQQTGTPVLKACCFIFKQHAFAFC